MKTITTYALNLAVAQLHNLNIQLEAAVSDDIDVAAYTAAIGMVKSAIAAFDDGDYPQGLALMNAAAEELDSPA